MVINTDVVLMNILCSDLLSAIVHWSKQCVCVTGEGVKWVSIVDKDMSRSHQVQEPLRSECFD